MAAKIIQICEICGHSKHLKACRVLMNKGTIHEIICGCNGPTINKDDKEHSHDI